MQLRSRLGFLVALAVAGLAVGGVARADVTLDRAFAGISLDRQFTDLAEAAWPPSPTTAVGPAHVVEVLNQSVAIFTRSGDLLSHVRLRDFLKITKNGVTYTPSFDPRVLFDAHSRRWFVACVGHGAGPTALPDPVILAVSRTSDPTGDWSTVLVPLGEPAVGNDVKSTFNLTLGVDDVGVYFGVRIFPTASPEFCKIAATPKAPLVGTKAKLKTVTQLSNLTGLVASPQPALVFDRVPPAGPAWVVASLTGGSGLRSWKVTWSDATPTITPQADLVTAAFGVLPDAAQSGTPTLIEMGDERLQSAVLRNGHLWTTRAIGVNATGTATGADRAGIEWFDLDLASGAPVVAQTGRVFDPGATPRFYSFPTLAANSQDEAVLSFSGSKASEFIGAYATTRLGADPAGTMSSVITVKSGEAPYVRTVGGNLNPFGRYGAVAIDPNDDYSFWVGQPFAAATATPNSWGTWITRIQLDTPPSVASVGKLKPLQLSFGKRKLATIKIKTITLSGNGSVPFVGTVGAATPPFTVIDGGGDFGLAKREKRKVLVQFSPTAVGPVAGALEIITTDPAMPTVTIPLTGEGK